MSETRLKNYRLRASIPYLLRIVALVGGLAAILALGLGFYFSSNNRHFRGKDFPAELSQNVIGIVNNYERKETENGVLKYYIKADIAKTFDDNHQEFENVDLRLFKDGKEDVFDRISSEKAVYIPVEKSSDYTVFFAGDVQIRTNDELEVDTDQLKYSSSEERAVAEEPVNFKRLSIHGKSIGAVVDTRNETLELNRDVEIFATGSADDKFTNKDIEAATLRAGSAFVDGKNEIVRLNGGIAISLTPSGSGDLKQPADLTSQNAKVFFDEREVRKIEMDGNVFVKQKPTANDPSWIEARSSRAVAYVAGEVDRLNMVDNVTISSKRGTSEPVFAKADNAIYERVGSVFELRDRVEITSSGKSGKTKAAGAFAIYRQAKGEVALTGAAQISQGSDLLKGDSITAELRPDNSLAFAKAEENAYLKQNKDGRSTVVTASTMSAWFADGQKLSKAQARGSTAVDVIPANKAEYSKLRLRSPAGLDLTFANSGSVSNINTLGRTTLNLNAGTNDSSAYERVLTADSIKTVFRPDANELSRAHAIGNAVLVVEPRSSAAGEYATDVRSPRFDCEFFAGNVAKNCVSARRSFVVRKPARGNRLEQKIEADRLDTVFEPDGRDVKLFEANGNAKYSEGDRRGIANKISYNSVNGIVSLRGGGPTIWDSRARAKAESIDWNTNEDNSILVGGVSTTYYSQKQTGNAAPFATSGSPVYLTSDTARFDHKARTGVYLGNARAWQEKNFVRGGRIYIEEKTSRFLAEENVESVLFDMERQIAGRRSKQPVFVSAQSMLYEGSARKIRYETKVDIRQGTDRITSNAADIYLNKDNSVTRTVASGDVVITQPNRKATGDFAQYETESEIIELRGAPAMFTDTESGSTTGRVVRVDMKNRKAENTGSDSKTKNGRIRSVYKAGQGRLN